MKPARIGGHGWRMRFRGMLLLVTMARLVAAEPGSSGGPKAPPPPIPAAVRPPVQFFRELLAADPARREELLAGKSAAARELILRRIREHEALPPAEREEADFQLRLAEFRFYLLPVLQAPAADRASLLARVPVGYQSIIAERLRAWDALDEAARRSVLESDQSLRYFVRQQTADPARLANVLGAVAPTQRAEVTAQFERWRGLSEAERADRTRAFRRIFDLATDRREKVLGRVDVTDRKGVERLLGEFSQMTPEERERSLAGFEKYSRLSPQERAEFLRNAARWQAMSPEERAAWRRLVLNLPPPPPLPPARPTNAQALVVTNR